MRAASVFEAFTTDKGLSNNSVYAVLQDHVGFLWVGAEDGLNRYDGVQFIQFRHDPLDPGSLSGNDVTCLLEDRENQLWIGTWDGGLNRYDRETNRFERFPNITDPGKNFVTGINCLHEDAKGRLWIGTKGEGLVLFDKEKNRFRGFPFVSDNPRSPENQIWSLTSEPSGPLLVGTDRGLFRFDPDSETFQAFSFADSKNGPNNDPIRSLLMDQSGHLWIGANRGLFRVGPNQNDIHFYGENESDGLEDETINTIFEDRRGTIWVGVDSGGLSRFIPAENGFRSYRGGSELGPISFGIRAINEDRSEIMWIGTQRGGLIKLDRKPLKFRSFAYDPVGEDGLSNPIVNAIMVDQQDNVWIGTEAGLDYLDRLNRSYTHYRLNPEKTENLAGNSVSALAADGEGRIWVGTHQGLYLFRDGARQSFLREPGNPNSLPNNEITCLKTDHLGMLWIGTRNGFSRYDGRFHNYHREAPNGAGGNRISTLFEDEHYSFWVGTESLGFSRFDRETGGFQDYLNDPNDRNSLSNNSVTSIHSFLGFFWIGTRGGLNRFNPETGQFRRYTIKDGLPGQTISGISDDRRSYLWISTNEGLTRFNPMTNEFRNYAIADGLLSSQFTIGAVTQSAQGELFFGGINGMNSFFPSLVKDNPYPPKVAITRLQVPTLGGKVAFPNRSEVRLSHRDNVVQFEFRSLDFTMPERNRYQFKLDGFDKDWSETGFVRNATYAGLAPDTYTFRVRASNNDGVWSKQDATARIIIQPPFYRTTWAMVLACVLLAVWSAWLIQGYRRRKRDRIENNMRLESVRINDALNRTRRFFLSNMSHELRTPLATIIGYAELLKEEVEDLSASVSQKDLIRDLTRIRTSAYHQLSLVTNLLDLSSIEMGQVELFPVIIDVEKMLDEMLAEFKPQLEPGNRFELRLIQPVGPFFNDPVKLQNILLNLLLNANQVTRAGDIILTVERVDSKPPKSDEVGWMVFTIEDTGSGLTQRALDDLVHPPVGSSRKKSGGMGLKLDLCRRLCEMMNGVMEVESEPGKGTKICIRFKILKNQP